MAIKLGELLVREGLVTEKDLEEALRHQVIYGGKLGGNLIEMGFVEEEKMARVLSKKLGITYVPPEKLQNLPSDLLDIVPKNIAEKYRVLPVARENKKVFLAMADPADLNAIDEIAFRIGYIVKPVLTPESRLLIALEQHYGIMREGRHGIKRERPSIPLDERVIRARKETEKDTASEEEEFIEIPGIDTPAESRTPSPSDETVHLSSSDIIEDVPEADIIEEDYSLDTFSRLLADAGGREDIADIVTGYLRQEFDHGALFQIRGSKACGWRSTVDGRDSKEFAQLEIDLDEPSVLKTVVQNRTCYLGGIPGTDANDRIFQRLGGYPASKGLLVPIRILERVVGLIYVDGEQSDLEDRTADLQKLAAKASLAFEILILKKKILML
ncbi:MAG: hypothetical protein R6V08_11575 [Desulfuromonadales bacterium]